MSKAKSRSNRALANKLAREVYVMQDPTRVNFWDILEGDTPHYFRMQGAQFSALASIRLARRRGERVREFAAKNARLQGSVLNCIAMAALGVRLSAKASSGVPFLLYPEAVSKALSASFPPRSESLRPAAE